MAAFEKFERKVRSAPLQSAAISFGAGWLLTRLPVFGILGLVTRVALALVKPSLLLLGGVKSWEWIQSRRRKSDDASG